MSINSSKQINANYWINQPPIPVRTIPVTPIRAIPL